MYYRANANFLYNSYLETNVLKKIHLKLNLCVIIIYLIYFNLRLNMNQKIKMIQVSSYATISYMDQFMKSSFILNYFYQKNYSNWFFYDCQYLFKVFYLNFKQILIASILLQKVFVLKLKPKFKIFINLYLKITIMKMKN